MAIYFPEGTPDEAKEDSVLGPSYWIHEECEKLPNNSENEVREWADQFYAYQKAQARGVLVYGKGYHHLDPNIRWILERCSSGIVLNNDLPTFGRFLVAMINRNDFHGFGTLSKMLENRAKHESRIREELGIAKGPSVMLKRFFAFYQEGRLPLKKELKESVRKTVVVEDDTFSKWLERYGLDGLPEAKRGPKRKKR